MFLSPNRTSSSSYSRHDTTDSRLLNDNNVAYYDEEQSSLVRISEVVVFEADDGSIIETPYSPDGVPVLTDVDLDDGDGDGDGDGDRHLRDSSARKGAGTIQEKSKSKSKQSLAARDSLALKKNKSSFRSRFRFNRSRKDKNRERNDDNSNINNNDRGRNNGTDGGDDGNASEQVQVPYTPPRPQQQLRHIYGHDSPTLVEAVGSGSRGVLLFPTHQVGTPPRDPAPTSTSLDDHDDVHLNKEQDMYKDEATYGITRIYDNDERDNDHASVMSGETTLTIQKQRRRRRWRALGVLVLLGTIIWLTIFLIRRKREPEFVYMPDEGPGGATEEAVGLTTNTDETTSATPAATASPSASPSSSPTFAIQQEWAFQILKDKVDDPSLLLDPTTSQGKAFQQLLQELGRRHDRRFMQQMNDVDDESSYSSSIENEHRQLSDEGDEFRLIQRYALMVLFQSLGGGDFDNDNDGRNDNDNGHWKFHHGWIDASDDECDWYGISLCRYQRDLDVSAVGKIVLTKNNLVGTIPNEICLLERMENITLYDNSIQGSIPDCIAGKLTKLQDFNVRDNLMDGPIPLGLLQQLPELESLVLSNNKFSGSLHALFEQAVATASAKSSYISSVTLSSSSPESSSPRNVDNDNENNNNVFYFFPAFDTLQILQLHSNQFSGIVPSSKLFFLNALRIFTIHDNDMLSANDGNGKQSLDVLCDETNSGTVLPTTSLTRMTADCDIIQCTCCTECF